MDYPREKIQINRECEESGPFNSETVVAYGKPSGNICSIRMRIHRNIEVLYIIFRVVLIVIALSDGPHHFPNYGDGSIP